MYVLYHIHPLFLQRSEDGIRASKNGVTDSVSHYVIAGNQTLHCRVTTPVPVADIFYGVL